MNMLEKFKKFLNVAPVTKQEESLMTTKEGQTALAAIDTAGAAAQLATATEALATSQTAIAEMSAKFAELSSKFEAAQAQLADVNKEKAEAIANAKATVTATRKAKLESVLGSEKTPSVLASLETLDDESFGTVVAAMATSLDKEAKSSMFTETGVDAETKVTSADPVQKLAASLAAQFNPK